MLYSSHNAARNVDGIALCGVTWRGMALCGVAWCGVVGHSMVEHGVE